MFAERVLLGASILISLAGCGLPGQGAAPVELETPALVLVNATLIDGTGSEPLPDAVLVIRGETIAAVGARSEVSIPAGAQVIDLQGGTILPGFFNAHVHDAFDAERLKTWAAAGVTTVRDESLHTAQTAAYFERREKELRAPEMARLVSSGAMMTVPGGYGSMTVDSVEDAVQKVNAQLDQGAEQIKLSLEDGIAGRRGMPKLSDEELKAIVDAAHARGVKVSAHITQGVYLQKVVEAGVDDAAHVIYDNFPPGLIAQMVEQGVYLVPTLTVFEAYGALEPSQRSLAEFVAAGGRVALGNDYTAIPQNNFDHFDLGMPMHEIGRMAEAGMTPMQIIVAATQNAAYVCGLEDALGTLEPGKQADVLVVAGDPLADLNALLEARLVVHGGVVIRDELSD